MGKWGRLLQGQPAVPLESSLYQAAQAIPIIR